MLSTDNTGVYKVSLHHRFSSSRIISYIEILETRGHVEGRVSDEIWLHTFDSFANGTGLVLQ
jgi:hypothetical protein